MSDWLYLVSAISIGVSIGSTLAIGLLYAFSAWGDDR